VRASKETTLSTKERKILIAVDGSPHSLNAVSYAAQYCAPAGIKVNIMHVMPTAPETLWDLEKDSHFKEKMTREYVERTKDARQLAEQFLSEALDLLIEAGIPENEVGVILQDGKVGIARDIIEESVRGYEAVVIGRGGLSKREDAFLGSVTNKIVEKIHDIPVWVIGEDAQAKKILLAVDASENSRKAVNYVGTISASTQSEITLFHVVRKFEFLDNPTLRRSEVEGFWAEVKSDIPRMFRSYKASLEKAGVTASRIKSQATLDRSSRSEDIVRQAQEGAYGTIVVGRRGLSKVHHFSMGRVANKVLNRAEGFAIWIVP
jgi:nucleotide-binding universal stress UspA family protein